MTPTASTAPDRRRGDSARIEHVIRVTIFSRSTNVPAGLLLVNRRGRVRRANLASGGRTRPHRRSKRRPGRFHPYGEHGPPVGRRFPHSPTRSRHRSDDTERGTRSLQSPGTGYDEVALIGQESASRERAGRICEASGHGPLRLAAAERAVRTGTPRVPPPAPGARARCGPAPAGSGCRRPCACVPRPTRCGGHAVLPDAAPPARRRARRARAHRVRADGGGLVAAFVAS